MKGLYEQELSDARKLLDDTAKEKAQLQIDVGKLKSDNEDLRLKWVERNYNVCFGVLYMDENLSSTR